MSTRLYGVLVDGLNKPLINTTVTLLARKNTLTILNGSEAVFKTDGAGAYNITVQAGHYNVIVGPQGIEPYKAGEIALYADSADGSLNGYLVNWIPEELTPEIILEVKQLVANAESYALASGRAAAAATLDATDARESKAAAQSAASDALTYKNDAKGSADAAKLAQQGASGSANTATQAVTTIQGLKSDVEQLKTDTQTIKDDAVRDVTALKSAAETAATTSTEQAVIATQGANTATTKASESSGFATRAETAATTAEGVLADALKKDQNLADLPDKAAARTNLELDRFAQVATEGRILTKDKTAWFGVGDSKVWGMYDNAAGAWVPLAIQQGGTGATDAAGARKNLGVDRIIQGVSASTLITSADPDKRLILRDDGAWGYFSVSNNAWQPLGIAQGGTNGVLGSGGTQTILQSPSKEMYLYVNDNGSWGAYSTVAGMGALTLGIGSGGTGANDSLGARTALGVGVADYPRFRGIAVQSASNTALEVYNTSVNEAFIGARTQWHYNATSNPSDVLLVRRNTNNTSGQIVVTMPTTNGIVALQGTSGRDYKESITPADSDEAMSRVMGVELVNFVYKDDEQKRQRFGVIAEDAEQVAPQYVKHHQFPIQGTEVFDDEGNQLSVEYRDRPSIDPNPIIMDLLGCIQNLQAQINELKAQLTGNTPTTLPVEPEVDPAPNQDLP